VHNQAHEHLAEGEVAQRGSRWKEGLENPPSVIDGAHIQLQTRGAY
jgi:hypothetical protein